MTERKLARVWALASDHTGKLLTRLDATHGSVPRLFADELRAARYSAMMSFHVVAFDLVPVEHCDGK